MSVLLQQSGPAAVQLRQDGLVGRQPGFHQSYGLPDIKHTHTYGKYSQVRHGAAQENTAPSEINK